MIWTIIIWLLNTWNIFYLIIWPMFNIGNVIKLLHDRAGQIKFLYDDDVLFFEDDIDVTPQNIKFIVCQLWLDDDSFYEWKMTENGDVLQYTPREMEREGRFKMRERMIFYKRRNRQENGDHFMRFKIVHTHSTRGLMGWGIRKYVTEPFVMAKMGGFKKYRFTDYVRR